MLIHILGSLLNNFSLYMCVYIYIHVCKPMIKFMRLFWVRIDNFYKFKTVLLQLQMISKLIFDLNYVAYI